MGRHAVADWTDYERDPAAYVHVPLDQLPTEPVRRRRSVLPAVVMLLGAAFGATMLVLLAQHWPGKISLGAGAALIGVVVVPYLMAMVGMLLLHWREL